MSESDDEAAPGWDAIDEALRGLYGDAPPRHFGTLIRWRLGGPDPLDGLSVYPSEAFGTPHWHYVSFGLTELYSKESEHAEQSGWGIELTMRLRRGEEADPPRWPLSLMQNLARYVFKTGHVLVPNDHMDVNGPIALPIAGEDETRLTSLLLTDDPELGPRDTPHGRMQFVQIVGATADELAASRSWNTRGVLGLVARITPGLVVDLARGSALDAPGARAAVAAGIEREGSSMGVAFMPELSFDAEEGAFELVLAASAVELLRTVLPGRLRFGRTLVLAASDARLDLVAGDELAYREDERPTLALPAAVVTAFADDMKTEEGRYQLAPGLTVVVTAG